MGFHGIELLESHLGVECFSLIDRMRGIGNPRPLGSTSSIAARSMGHMRTPTLAMAFSDIDAAMETRGQGAM